MNLSSVDLNLLVVLDAVLAERNATRAAARLHVTQSAVSNALARLRATLGDPLVVRSGRGLAPTRRALELEPALRRALSAIADVVEPPRFELATSTRAFKVALVDVHATVVLPALVAKLRKAAPLASVQVVPLGAGQGDWLATGEVDLYIGAPGERRRAGWRSEPLFTTELVAVVRRAHSLKRKPTAARFAALPHVRWQLPGGRNDGVDSALARLGLERHVVLTVPHYDSVFSVVATTDCTAVVWRRTAEARSKPFELRVLELPFALPRLDIDLHWHERAESDPAVMALRTLVREAVRYHRKA